MFAQKNQAICGAISMMHLGGGLWNSAEYDFDGMLIDFMTCMIYQAAESRSKCCVCE